MYPIVSGRRSLVLLGVTPLQVLNIPKVSAHPAKFTTTNNSSSPMQVSIPPDITIALNVAGLHYNGRFIVYVIFFTDLSIYLTEKYWEEPFQFKPERFIKGDYNKDAFIPFSAGPRACIGRRFVYKVIYVDHVPLIYNLLYRFAEVEALAVLTLMVLHYKIEVTEEPQYAAESFEQRKERILKGSVRSLTLVADGVSLTFKRR